MAELKTIAMAVFQNVSTPDVEAGFTGRRIIWERPLAN
jgi:hypothetical protein